VNKKLDEYPEILTTKELQEILPLAKNNLYKLLNQDGFPVRRSGKKYLVSREALRKWFEDNK